MGSLDTLQQNFKQINGSTQSHKEKKSKIVVKTSNWKVG